MHLWIVTIGSSDVQLISDKANQAKGRTEKQRSDKVWSYWYTDDLRADCYDISFEPKQPFKDKEETYRIAPRILGRVYQASDQSLQKEIWDYLTFPLLDNFVQALADCPTPEVIAVLLTDQSTIFESDHQRKPNSPYWQDTCELKPILQTYFAEKFPDALCEFIPLISNSNAESLDNWNAVLDLVRGKFRNLTIVNQPIQVDWEENAYVSHQAGTPAISSAVQFCSLAKFGDRVKFLVSNEYNANLCEKPLEGSSYLRGIRIQEAKALLNSHNYAGVKDLLDSYLEDEKHREVKILLEAAIQWNFAKFDEFANKLQKLSNQDLAQVVKERSQCWWWTAYEAAYLAFIRLDQKNAVEAFFHSFRAVEGLISIWTEVTYPDHVDSNNDSPQVKFSILEELPDYLSNKKQEHLLSELKEKQKLGLHSFPLYDLLRKGKPDWRQKCKDLSLFTDQIAPKRNKLFHRLKGLEVSDVFQEWKVNDLEGLEVRIWRYLNFISDQSFNSLTEASLMVKVHQELERAIAAL